MKKLVIAFVLLFTLTIPSMTEARGFSGGHSSFSHVSSFGSHSSSTRSSGTYHSGYKSPSKSFSKSIFSGIHSPRRSSFWSHAAAFGAGTFFGRMFHPFGGYYGHSSGFSIFGFLVDILIIFIIIRIIKGIFTRRRY
jgi:hypothetical protein